MTDHPDYLARQLITCIGNKRALLGDIGAAVETVTARLGRRRIRILDGFSGSGAVSRLFKAHAERLVVNDLEPYAVAVARCHLMNRSAVDLEELAGVVSQLNDEVDRQPPVGPGQPPAGFIEELYAPRDDEAIQPGERVFYTRANARRLDAYRQRIARLPEPMRTLCLGPLLAAASVHANTAGVFKGFYKDRRTGLGRFGGTRGDALTRILGQVRLEAPVLSGHECDVEVSQGDINQVVGGLGEFDLAYFDPPYNQHPYGSNYFMLNLLAENVRPTGVSRVSGIPARWRRSAYNARPRAYRTLVELLHATPARFILLSFSDEGFVAREDLDRALSALGRVSVVERRYNAFRGSRNLSGRRLHVTEQLFLVERTVW